MDGWILNVCIVVCEKYYIPAAIVYRLWLHITTYSYMWLYIYIYIHLHDGKEIKGYLIVKRLRPKASSGKYVKYNCVCDIIYKNIIWYHVMSWKFSKFVYNSNPLKQCPSTEMNWKGAELWLYEQPVPFNYWLNPSRYKVSSF